ncbi:hypothetical protein AA103196_2875 [Ameyamaea chiangmaiensis NBRC 103196]|uniref:Uncharacterized protein n=1 Tax=Ameyamaea chiangmaiensis TaxID=442969 RepID=A0A850PAF1_9PROT|nr:hypothetical protein [Ameyamaea chiangmaiensis]MBS4074362.1 hypothetical protein [Ameyamaea chiangmaiensis]NVN41024.1 hypothetical protein [Ameyamaea chiangmaiensis]GBQ71782.1 hypothetical protein AA103196_2875 [Ameyamaea chiangmaiensis NBRC 103196]
MKREQGLLIGLVVLVIGTVILLWSFAVPNFRPLDFPKIQSGTLTAGPMRTHRALTDNEIARINDWLAAHRSGWGPLGQTPPSSGDALYTLQPVGRPGEPPPPPMTMTLWLGISGPDWNDTVFIEPQPGAVIRLRSFSKHEFAPLREIVEPQPFQRSGFP